MEGGADVDVKWRQKSPRPQFELAAEEMAIVAIKIGALYYSEGRTKRSNRTMEFLTLYCISGRGRERIILRWGEGVGATNRLVSHRLSSLAEEREGRGGGQYKSPDARPGNSADIPRKDTIWFGSLIMSKSITKTT